MHPAAKRWLPLLPAAILTAVALAQRALLLTTPLTPWMGGGFAMFTTVDGINARHLRCFVATTGGEIAIAAPIVPETLLTFPTRAALHDVATDILVEHPSSSHVRAEVWSFRFDRDRGVAIPYPVLSVEVKR